MPSRGARLPGLAAVLQACALDRSIQRSRRMYDPVSTLTTKSPLEIKDDCDPPYIDLYRGIACQSLTFVGYPSAEIQRSPELVVPNSPLMRFYKISRQFVPMQRAKSQRPSGLSPFRAQRLSAWLERAKRVLGRTLLNGPCTRTAEAMRPFRGFPFLWGTGYCSFAVRARAVLVHSTST
eukprot:COSAG01_NODE_1686_length_9495_cov_5.741166_1_plen_179_part_00